MLIDRTFIKVLDRLEHLRYTQKDLDVLANRCKELRTSTKSSEVLGCLIRVESAAAFYDGTLEQLKEYEI